MTKIVYNSCFGGFSLSADAVRLARELSGNPKWGDCVLVGEKYADGSGTREIFLSGESCHINGIPRHDPILVSVVEQLGSKANGMCAELDIEDVPSGTRYRIDEYDGNERVMTVEDYDDWEIA